LHRYGISAREWNEGTNRVGIQAASGHYN